jgi:hypothetical protein
MLEYREQKKDALAAASDGAAPMPVAPAPKAAPAFMSLAERYGLPDMGFDAEDTDEQTVEQEYQSYVTASLSRKGTDILKFWEVSYCYSNGS